MQCKRVSYFPPPPPNVPLRHLAKLHFALSAKSGMLYASPPHPREPTTAPGPAVHARLAAPTRESLVNGPKPCLTYLSSGYVFSGGGGGRTACTFRHDSPVPKSGWLFVAGDMDDDGSVGEDSAANAVLVNHGGGVSEEEEEMKVRYGKGEQAVNGTLCIFSPESWNVSVCCFYTHGKDGSTSAAGDKHVPIQRPTPLTASNKKLEGEWRCPEPQSPSAAADREKAKQGSGSGSRNR